MLFRMGDFYEMFFEDAITASRVLELTLTSRAKDSSGTAIPMCGMPYHAVDGYLSRLIRKGYRVAICEQVEDPKKAKGVVKREVTRVVSPGTFTDAGYLDAREPAFLAAVVHQPPGRYGVACLDVSTGEFSAAEFDALPAVSAELAVLRPKEILVADDLAIEEILSPLVTPRVTRLEPWIFETARARDVLLDQLRASSLAGYGLDTALAATAAAGGIVHYLRTTQRVELAHVRDISRRLSADALLIDPVTLRHLNVVEGVDGGRTGSLLDE
ncbi:MAG TPA: hypothetical protein VMZ90_10765, partial [Vicinamibacterales bacterium]|nr:hypothetical protein [Vicinamibacterales bacterium]